MRNNVENCKIIITKLVVCLSVYSILYWNSDYCYQLSYDTTAVFFCIVSYQIICSTPHSMFPYLIQQQPLFVALISCFIATSTCRASVICIYLLCIFCFFSYTFPSMQSLGEDLVCVLDQLEYVFTCHHNMHYTHQLIMFFSMCIADISLWDQSCEGQTYLCPHFLVP